MADQESSRYLLIGGGLASANAAEAIRKEDAEGSITILALEPHRPYDRPPLSKNFQMDDKMAVADIESKKPDFYDTANVVVKTGSRVVDLDRANKVATTENGDKYPYEYLLIATGASPKPAEGPGSDLQGVDILRWVEEAEQLRNDLNAAKSVVLLGSGFIGMEVAADALKKGLTTTIVSPDKKPWSKFASDALGDFLVDYFTQRGLDFRFGDKVVEFVGEGGMVNAVRTKLGAEINADVVVVGIGVTLETEIAARAGLAVTEEGIDVNQFLQTEDAAVWAAGDVANFDDIAMGLKWHVEHYMNAQWQGETVGYNMAAAAHGKDQKSYDRVPYFFSDMGDLHMVLRGNAKDTKTTRFIGDVKRANFVELYPDADGVLKMGIAISEDQDKLEPISDTLEQLIRDGVKVDAVPHGLFNLDKVAAKS